LPSCLVSSDLVAFEISSPVLLIEKETFRNRCDPDFGYRLNAIHNPVSVEVISEHSFFRCSELTSIKLSCNWELHRIEDVAFADTCLRECVFPGSLIVMSVSAFALDHLEYPFFLFINSWLNPTTREGRNSRGRDKGYMRWFTGFPLDSRTFTEYSHESLAVFANS
jgi:hypothetical protein